MINGLQGKASCGTGILTKMEEEVKGCGWRERVEGMGYVPDFCFSGMSKILK
jgi:hypothetical protein